MPNVLVVCTANICRSPVAEALLRDRLQKREPNRWTVESAGTWAQIERGAAPNSIQLMAELGLDLTGHRARLIDETVLQTADLVLCMESGHAEALRTEFPSSAAKVYLLSTMVGQDYNIQDPYGLSIEAYRPMVAEITSIIDLGLDRIMELAWQNAPDGPLGHLPTVDEL
jgi:protein-tyrosine phosphatase